MRFTNGISDLEKEVQFPGTFKEVPLHLSHILITTGVKVNSQQHYSSKFGQQQWP